MGRSVRMKQNGNVVPIPDMLEWWIPFGVAVPLCIFLACKAWRYREVYRPWFIAFNVFYLGWSVARGIAAVLTSSRLNDFEYYFRVLLSLVAVFLVMSTYSSTKKRYEEKRDRETYMVGPEDALWSPEPIVGYRWSIHSMHEEPYTGQRAVCRHGSEYHSSADIPMWGCRCGYYAMKHWGEMGSSLVVVTFMWGRVIEHAGGYRSEYMRPIGYLNTHEKPLHPSSIVLAMEGHDYFRNFLHLPLAQSVKELDALIEKARKEFDPAAPPPYDGGHYGYRTTSTEN